MRRADVNPLSAAMAHAHQRDRRAVALHRDMLSRRAALAAGLGGLVLAGCTDGNKPPPQATPQPTSPGTVSPTVPLPSPPTSTGTGNVRYVSPDGSDKGSGSPDQPWRKIETALGRLQAGDTLYIADGVYSEDIEVAAAPGTREAKIFVRPVQGARPLLRGLLWIDQPTWWDIRGLNVTWAKRNKKDEHMVKMSNGTDWVLGDAELSFARSYAALAVVQEPKRFQLTGLYVHDTRNVNANNQDHLLYLNCGTGGGVVERCLLTGSPNGRAVKVGPADLGSAPLGNITVRFCTMVDNRGPSNVQLTDNTSNVHVERNVMVGSGRGRPNVTAFQLVGRGNVVKNNIGWDSTAVMEAARGLVDGGGNRHVDPGLTALTTREPFATTASGAQGYGRWAPDTARATAS